MNFFVRNGSVVYQSGEDYNWIYIVKSGVCGMCRWQMVPNLQHKKKSLSNTDSSKQSEMTEVECVALERAKFRVEQSELMRSRSSSSTTNYLRNDSIRPGTFDDLNKTWNFEDKEDHNEVFSFYTHLLKNKSTNDMDYTLLSTVKENNFRTKPSPKHGEADELIEIKSNLKRLSSIYSKDHYKTTRIKSSISILSKSSSSGSFLKRSVPPMRRAFLEVGKLTVGGVYGLHDEIGTTEEPMEISLVSYGAEVVVIHRNFFLRHAPADLLSKLSWTNQEVPSKKEAGETLKIIETWNMYKTALLNQLSPSTKSSRTKEENVDMTTTSKLSATQSDKTKKRREVLRRTVSAAHFTSKFDYKQYRPCSMPHIK